MQIDAYEIDSLLLYEFTSTVGCCVGGKKKQQIPGILFAFQLKFK